ncbi:MAG: hypothetical protein LBU90_10510 [Bacteroidales bacterium]|jgi:hypothetical protein|nr:hypothetical protein [Bacteroidales bacterium]
MNRIELQDNGFPMTAKTLRFLQEAYQKPIEFLAREAAVRAGGNCILYGVEQTSSGGAWTDGAIVYNNEILPFVGGSGNYFSVKNTPEQAVYKNGLSVDAYFTRYAQTDTSGTAISTLKRLNEPAPTAPANTAWASPTWQTDYADMATYPLKCRIYGGKGQIVGTYERTFPLPSQITTDSYTTILTLPSSMKPKKEQWITAQISSVSAFNSPNNIFGAGLLQITTGGLLRVQYNKETRGMGLIDCGVIAATFDLL